MKKLFLLFTAVLFTAILFNSCKKDSKPVITSTSSMKFTSNGTAISYNTCLQAAITVGSSKQIAIVGTNLTGNKASDDSFEIEIMHDIATLKAGQTYPAATSFAEDDSSTLSYSLNDTDSFNTQPGNAEGTVTITEVTATTVKGTFSGKLYAQDDVAGAHLKYTITGGTFTALHSK